MSVPSDPSLVPGWTPTQWIALYAALLSSGTLVWNIYKDGFWDRAKLRVWVGMMELIGDGRHEHDLIVFKITNTGGKPIKVTHVCVEGTGTTNFLVMDDALPKKIEPGDYHHTMCRQYGDFAEKAKAFYVTDSLGRDFYASKKQTKELIAAIKKLAVKGITASWVGGED